MWHIKQRVVLVFCCCKGAEIYCIQVHVHVQWTQATHVHASTCTVNITASVMWSQAHPGCVSPRYATLTDEIRLCSRY